MPEAWPDLLFKNAKKACSETPCKVEKVKVRKKKVKDAETTKSPTNKNSSRFSFVYIAKGEKLT